MIFNNENIKKFKANSDLKLSTNDILHAILLKSVNEYKDESIVRDENTYIRLFFARNMRSSFQLGTHTTGDYVRLEENSFKPSDGSLSLLQLAEQNRKVVLDTTSLERYPNECLWFMDYPNRREGVPSSAFLCDKLSSVVTNWSTFPYEDIHFGESRVYELLLENKTWATPTSSFVRVSFRGIGAERQIIAVCDTLSQEFVDTVKNISAESELFTCI